MMMKKITAVALACVIGQPGVASLSAQAAQASVLSRSHQQQRRIKHLVVIFNENISFDHYFGTYPNALNPRGEPSFRAVDGTPAVNGLSGALLTANPNALNTANGTGAVNPFRLTRAQAWTADQGHNYAPEQVAVDKGLMDLFPKSVGTANSGSMPQGGPLTTKGLTMGYFDGNTVTALWNYAQHFAMSDNSYGTVFGPSTVGALNLIAGQTNGVSHILNGQGAETDGSEGSLSVIGDPDPYLDVCSGSTTNQVEMKGKNIGDLLSQAGLSWGWFQGGFDLTVKNPNGTTGCARSSASPLAGTSVDYVPHHQPFQYYPSTRNTAHTRPTSVHMIGKDGDAANHQYDLNDFYAAVKAGNFPAVSFLKPQKFQNAHPGNSTPLDEQTFLVHVINFLQQTPEWCETAVIIAYDDSDGWYDHQMGPIVNQSSSPADALTGPQACGNGATALPGPDGVDHAQGRCGYGPRLPLLVISPLAKTNFVDHTVTDQSSILRFIEDNWLDGARIGDGSFDTLAGPIDSMFDLDKSNRCEVSDFLFLDESSGQPIGGHGRY
jgi:phospholipase C